ncbi:MAG TPA: DUF3703 domain-containing protein [Pseudomonas xinjiangensis]|uniref:DUF3703 domain-containing protein n=2 Tax=root TaxID=1 RepID=A0A7V1BS31_9GAMM|nr:DUF3703 domain-containing protein [Halopseudomonas xinjiangensis]HEC46522.1 DUF3703 domain-containing protein [Halopseudomonas xinjiangensis]
MDKTLKSFYRSEIAAARDAVGQGNLQQAFVHLELAHILSQRCTLAHAATHLRMLKLGWQQGNAGEVRGQIFRALAALLFSRIWVPVGNTGRASVSAFAPMPLPEDLARVLAASERRSKDDGL